MSLGNNEVVLGVLNVAGNVAYCTNYVLVVDQTPPTISCRRTLWSLRTRGSAARAT